MRPIIDEDLRNAVHIEAGHRRMPVTRYVNDALRRQLRADKDGRAAEELKGAGGLGGTATRSMDDGS